MKNIQIYKKGFLIGMSAVLLSNVTGCSSIEVVDTKTETVSEDPEWVTKRMYEEDEKEFTKEEIEKAALDAFEMWSTDIENNFQSFNNSAVVESAKDKIANTFIQMTDFLFYGDSIEYGDGKTVSLEQLGEEAVEKMILIYSIVDSKIESYWPNYKEEIEEKRKLAVGYISDKANSLKLYLLDKVSEHMSEEDYERNGVYWQMFKEQAKEDFEDGKDLLKDLLNKGIDFADEKYQDFKAEHEQGYHK